MKTKSILAAALALGMLAACQKEAPVGTQDDGATASTNAYVSVSINLPSTTSTRANDDYNDGEASEYKVNDVLIILYDADDKVVTVNGETPSPWLDNDSANITLTAKSKAIETKHTASKVLVLINANGVVSEDNAKKKSFTELNDVLKENAALTSGDLFMSNAPYFDANGNAVYLVPVIPQSSEDLALQSPATVNVERAAVKVQVDYKDTYDITNKSNTKIATATVEGWDLDMTSNSFYPVRQVLSNWHNINYPLINGSSDNGSRIYFAIDPHYNKDAVLGDEGDLKNNASLNFDLNKAGTNIAYCFENTFDIAHQYEDETTRVVLKVKYAPTGITAGNTWFRYGTGKTIADITGLQTAVETELAKLDITLEDDDKSSIKTTIEALAAGKVSDSSIYGNYTLNDLLGEVICYKDGICYYRVLLRHFNAVENGYGASATDSNITAAEQKFMGEFEKRVNNEQAPYIEQDLGRYGVVRNNWYVVEIEGISGPGSPTIPDTPNAPDDAVDKYVACNINILAWCKRNQSVIL